MQLPGRTINTESRLFVTRTLPADGEVLVRHGQRVEALDVVARVDLPRRYCVIDVARQLAQPRVEMDRVMFKTWGEAVQKNEVVAVAGGGLPFLKRSARAPVAGRIAAIGPGWVLLETERAVVEIQAFINGVVSKIIPQRGAIIEATGTRIEAACGFGGEAYGRLMRLVDSPFDSMPVEALTEKVEHTILIAGRSVDEAVLRQAETLHVRGIIVGSIAAGLLKLNPPVRVRVVATEGFGNMPMSPYTFGMLNSLVGREISMRGQTPVLPAAGTAVEPPVIMATTSYTFDEVAHSPEKQPTREIKVGSRVRITQGEWLGMTGHIADLSPKPQATGSGLVVPGATVTLNDQQHFVPWANLEQVN